ncbi:hypothetical protein EDB81DRAFT_787540 [Dactylonectria macrodidyma]|uniref:Uncharacterized protein n=1 Tax=Dactylonectria macrodidyma TaxID=307937 RepID=A0A9P9F9E3_9HYPO|nr:hypothetical protein EDB81DRAFT_787540 [Dactylonectria macrodidyma]
MLQRCYLAGGQGHPSRCRAAAFFAYRHRKVPTQLAPKRKTVTQWTCCVCGHSGMSVNIPVCPFCQTPRCAYCNVERVRVKPAHLFSLEISALASQNSHLGDDHQLYDTDIKPFFDDTCPPTRSTKDHIYALTNEESLPLRVLVVVSLSTAWLLSICKALSSIEKLFSGIWRNYQTNCEDGWRH